MGIRNGNYYLGGRRVSFREWSTAPDKCPSGKRRYPDSVSAGYALGTAAKQVIRVTGTRPIRSYKCDRCPYWHLSSKPLSDYPVRRPTAT